ncbi:MAG: hypothetical protein PHX72_02605 [Candidatus Shapirobacteria bacterium]|nr:hypothetical protein [Candidatus Shapirobacteria bacterium]
MEIRKLGNRYRFFFLGLFLISLIFGLVYFFYFQNERDNEVQQGEFPVNENNDFFWEVDIQDYGFDRKALLHGSVSQEPIINEDDFVFFSIRIELGNDSQEIELVLGHNDWYVSSSKILEEDFLEERTWNFVQVKELIDQLRSGDSVEVLIPIEFGQELEIVRSDCDWCKEKLAFDRRMAPENIKVLNMLTNRDVNFRKPPKMGSVSSLAY